MRETWEEGTAVHSSILAWRIPWTEEPGGLQFTGSQRVRHDPATKHRMRTAMRPGAPQKYRKLGTPAASVTLETVASTSVIGLMLAGFPLQTFL